MILHAPKEIGALIRERRSHMNLSQHELAGKVGVSRAWIIALEKGKPSVQLGLVLQTLRELGIPLRAGAEANERNAEGIDIDALVDSHSKGKKP
jgi:HTH-type transcriptional regulator/antitoxin HipB